MTAKQLVSSSVSIVLGHSAVITKARSWLLYWKSLPQLRKLPHALSRSSPHLYHVNKSFVDTFVWNFGQSHCCTLPNEINTQKMHHCGDACSAAVIFSGIMSNMLQPTEIVNVYCSCLLSEAGEGKG